MPLHLTPPPTVPPNEAALLAEIAARRAWKQGVLGAMNVAVWLLAVRMILLLAVVGAVILTWYALTAPDPFRLGAVALYTVTVVVPLVWLARR